MIRRKAIASVVGGIFFLVLMTSGFTVYYVALDSQSEMLDTQQIIADNEVAKIQEKFVVAASSDPGDNNRLSIQVVNTGNNPIEIADVWIINKTDATEPAKKYYLDYRDVSIPVGYSGNILENTPLYLSPEIFNIKVVSNIGTIQTVEYDVNGGSNVLSAQMVAIPQDVRFGENATVALVVTNTGEFQIDEVRANTEFEVSPNQCRDPPNMIFGGPSDLAPAQSTLFFWDCILDTPIGNTITFTGNASGLLSGVPVDSNDASDRVVVRDFSSSGEEIVLKDEFFGKPELLMIFPNPMGDDENDRALWGVNVANPTDQPIDVSKVVIVAVSPRATSSDTIFKEVCEVQFGSNLKPVTVSPTTDRWSCPESNQLQWQDLSNPQIIQPRSVFPFLVKIGSDTIGSTSQQVNNIPIETTVFSTLGQFGKSGYLSTMNKEPVALPNVYLSKVPGSVNPADILGEIRGITAGTSVIFNATIADMDQDTTYGINSGSRLIINIPKEWNYNGWISHVGFNTPSEVTFPDGSTQIIGELSSALDGNNDAATIQFSATAPTVTKAKMYVMHILADGIATGLGAGDYAVGPIAESVLQVCPITGCP